MIPKVMMWFWVICAILGICSGIFDIIQADWGWVAFEMLAVPLFIKWAMIEKEKI